MTRIPLPNDLLVPLDYCRGGSKTIGLRTGFLRRSQIASLYCKCDDKFVNDYLSAEKKA